MAQVGDGTRGSGENGQQREDGKGGGEVEKMVKGLAAQPGGEGDGREATVA